MLVHNEQMVDSDILENLINGLEIVPDVVQDNKNTIIRAKSVNDYQELLCRTKTARQKRMEGAHVFTQEAKDAFVGSLLKEGHEYFEKNLTSMSIYKVIIENDNILYGHYL